MSLMSLDAQSQWIGGLIGNHHYVAYQLATVRRNRMTLKVILLLQALGLSGFLQTLRVRAVSGRQLNFLIIELSLGLVRFTPD